MTNLDGQMIPFAPLKEDRELTKLFKNKSNIGFTKSFLWCFLQEINNNRTE